MDVKKLLIPVNSTAAKVVNQAQINDESEYVKLCREQQDINSALRRTDYHISKAKREKVAFEERKHQLCRDLSEVKEKLKLIKMQKNITLNDLIREECKKHFSEEKWRELVGSCKREYKTMLKAEGGSNERI